MKHWLLICALFLPGIQASSQAYQCLLPASKVYFTNGHGYLRGMRIDSTHASGTNILHYPFRTPRGEYNQNQYLDTTGGSWLGKVVTEKADGTTLFSNGWHDTVVINTAALPGRPWIFYSDTSSYYYTATVSTIDTMTITGSLDSVKHITIQAMYGATPVSSFINSYRILLSKSHGFVQVFDLYNFPYGLPGPGYTNGLDYYVDANCDAVDTSRSHFRRVQITPTRWRDNYDWHPGDILQYAVYNPFAPETIVTDSVMERIEVGTSLNYKHQRTTAKWNPTTSFPPHILQVSKTIVTEPVANVDGLIFTDTTRMPEEWPNPTFHYYIPAGANFAGCPGGAAFGAVSSLVRMDGRIQIFEPCGYAKGYREGYGEISYDECHDPTPGSPLNVSRRQIYSKLSGHPCGNYDPLSVPESPTSIDGLRLYPNPATDNITLRQPQGMQSPQPITTSIYSMEGRELRHISWRNTAVVSISDLPPGTYTVRSVSGKQTFVQMLVVASR